MECGRRSYRFSRSMDGFEAVRKGIDVQRWKAVAAATVRRLRPTVLTGRALEAHNFLVAVPPRYARLFQPSRLSRPAHPSRNSSSLSPK